ncbi:histidine--tRNA ligase [archaeon]
MYQTVRGMRDLGPEEMKKRQFFWDKVRKAYESYGFSRLETPAVESFDLLSAKGGGGQEIKKEIYYFKDQGDRELGLRFDMTVPTARYVASDASLAKPFKRYCYGQVWRYDRPQAGRYREFTQCDIDVFGVATPAADFEIFAATVDAFLALGFKKFVIRVNNKKLLAGLMDAVGIKDDKKLDAWRAIDKQDKIGWDGVEEELDKKKVPNPKKIIDLIKGNKITKEMTASEIGAKGKEEMDAFLALAKAAGMEKYVKVDLSLVRGLEYYTGITYEVMAGGKWSCGGGGRYDNLIKLLGGQDTAAVGISYGVDRVIQLMDEAGLFPPLGGTKCFVAAVNDSVRQKAVEIATELRKSGVSAETDLAGKSLGKQFAYCNSKGIPYCVIAGPKELESGEAVLRDMESGNEETVKLGELAGKLK